MYKGKVGMHKQVKSSERGHKTLIFACLLCWFKNPSLNCQKQTEIISIYTAQFSEFCSLKKSKQELLYFPWPCLTIQNRKMTMWSALNEWVVLTTSPLSFPLSWFDLLVIRLVQLCYLWSFGGLLAINYNVPSFSPPHISPISMYVSFHCFHFQKDA